MRISCFPVLVVVAMQPGKLQPVSRDQLCVTNGDITTAKGRLAINTPSSRAIVLTPVASGVAEIRFTYLGPSEGSKPLASGEMRRQIGLKLRALNQCNLLYVMWRIEPESKLVVQVKRNPGQSTHEQCDAHGYVTVRPQSSMATAPLLAGQSHTLHAEITGDDLTVTADGRVAWRGSIGKEITGIDGPIGLRTDNARFELDYYARPTGDGSTQRCEASGNDSGAD